MGFDHTVLRGQVCVSLLWGSRGADVGQMWGRRGAHVGQTWGRHGADGWTRCLNPGPSTRWKGTSSGRRGLGALLTLANIQSLRACVYLFVYLKRRSSLKAILLKKLGFLGTVITLTTAVGVSAPPTVDGLHEASARPGLSRTRVLSAPPAGQAPVGGRSAARGPARPARCLVQPLTDFRKHSVF